VVVFVFFLCILEHIVEPLEFANSVHRLEELQTGHAHEIVADDHIGAEVVLRSVVDRTLDASFKNVLEIVFNLLL
jgi:hypothetical protein